MRRPRQSTLSALIALACACGGANSSELFAGSPAAGDSGVSPEGTDPVTTPTGEEEAGATESDASIHSDAGTTKDTAPPDEKDAATQPDTNTPPPSDPGIFCGTTPSQTRKYCDVDDQKCCIKNSNFSCLPATGNGSDCSGISVPCTDTADCDGKICCAAYNNVSNGYDSVACQDTCTVDSVFYTEYRLCDPTAAVDECADVGMTCVASTAIKGWYVCGS